MSADKTEPESYTYLIPHVSNANGGYWMPLDIPGFVHQEGRIAKWYVGDQVEGGGKFFDPAEWEVRLTFTKKPEQFVPGYYRRRGQDVNSYSHGVFWYEDRGTFTEAAFAKRFERVEVTPVDQTDESKDGS